VIHVQWEGVSDVMEEGTQEPMASPLTERRVGFMLLSVYRAS